MRTIILMMLGHLVADYTLQGWLADAKQIKWWRKNTSDEKYRHDWIAGLLCHSLYWSILACLPLYCSKWFPLAVLVNAAVHAVVDHLKCNEMKINLVEDQSLHLIQIMVTYAALEVFG